MNLQEVFCPYAGCIDKGVVGKGKGVWWQKRRKRCKRQSCGRTFSCSVVFTIFAAFIPPSSTPHLLWLPNSLTICGLLPSYFSIVPNSVFSHLPFRVDLPDYFLTPSVYALSFRALSPASPPPSVQAIMLRIESSSVY